MGFCNVGEMNPGDVEGYCDFLEPGSDAVKQLTAQPNHALTMLLAFRDTIR